MPVAFGELIDELLDARRRLRNDLFLFTLLELYLCAECALEQQFEIRRNGWRFALGALRVSTLARLKLKLFRRTAGSDLVLLGRSIRHRISARLGAFALIFAVGNGVQSHREFAGASWSSVRSSRDIVSGYAGSACVTSLQTQTGFAELRRVGSVRSDDDVTSLPVVSLGASSNAV